MPYPHSPTTASQGHSSFHRRDMSSNFGSFGVQGSSAMYSGNASPTAPPSGPPGYGEATTLFGPPSPGNTGTNNNNQCMMPRHIHQKTASGNSSSFTDGAVQNIVAPQPMLVESPDKRWPPNGKAPYDETRRLSKRDMQPPPLPVHRDETSYFRSKWIAAAAERRVVVGAYQRDVCLLLSVVERLLSRVAPMDAGKDAFADRKESDLENTAASRRRIALLSALMEEVAETNPPSVEASAIKGAKGPRQPHNNVAERRAERVERLAGMQEIASTLSLAIAEGGPCGVLAAQDAAEASTPRAPANNRGAAVDLICSGGSFLVEEEMRDVAVEAQRSIEGYLSSLNFGFPCGRQSHMPLSLQIPVLLEGGGTASGQ